MLAEVALLPQQFADIIREMELVKKEIQQLKETKSESWMSIIQAAKALDTTRSAIYQRINNKENPMPEGVVWQQKKKNGAIKVHLGNYRKYM